LLDAEFEDELPVLILSEKYEAEPGFRLRTPKRAPEGSFLGLT